MSSAKVCPRVSTQPSTYLWVTSCSMRWLPTRIGITKTGGVWFTPHGLVLHRPSITGAALARNEPDQKRQRRLEQVGRRATVESFAKKAKSAFFVHEAPSSPLGTLEAFRRFAAYAPDAAAAWQHRLKGLTQDKLQSIVDQLPAGRMTPIARRFTIELIRINQQRILEVSFQQ